MPDVFYAGQTDYIAQLNLINTNASTAGAQAAAAAASATAAANSATTAGNHSTTAGTRAAAALASQTAAATSASAAATSQTAAGTSASAAAASQTAAAASAVAAGTSASAAAASQTAAAASAVAAGTSASAAAASQTAAAAAAVAAGTSASAAAASQTAAAASAVAAGTSASAAAASQTAASTAAAAAATEVVTAGTVAASFASITTTGNSILGDAEAADTHTIKGVTTILANSANPALKITQTGVGNAFVVEDAASTDSTPFVIDVNGKAIFGYTSSLGSEHIQSVGTDYASSSISMLSYQASTAPAYLSFGKSRSATVGHTVVASGDDLGILSFSGSDGATFINGANIRAQVDGTPGTGDMPGRLVFSTTPDGQSTPIEAMRIDSTGRVKIGTTGTGGVLLVTGKTATSTSSETMNYSTFNLNAASGSGTYVANATFLVANAGHAGTGANILHQVAITNQATGTLTDVRGIYSTFATTGGGNVASRFGFMDAGITLTSGTVTNNYAFYASSANVGATNNYGFVSAIPYAASTVRWNFYASGNAPNHFAGNVGIGTAVIGNQLQVQGGTTVLSRNLNNYSTTLSHDVAVYSGVGTSDVGTPQVSFHSDRSDRYASIGHYRGANSNEIGLSFFVESGSGLQEALRIDGLSRELYIESQIINILNNVYPSTRPSLTLDFANSRALDYRISFSRGSTATRVNEKGIREVVAIDIPRFDYDPVNLYCKGLLVESTRTNLVTYSAITNANWVDNTNGLITGAGVTAPDGSTSISLTAAATLTSTLVRANAANVSFTLGSVYTSSVYIKKGNMRYAYIISAGTGFTSGDAVAFFDLDTGSVNSINSLVSSATVTPAGGGWYRCTMTMVAAEATGAESMYIGHSNSSGNQTHNATAAQYTYFWGAQVELGAHASSYIPTTTVAVTRTADLAHMVSTDFTDWYNQLEGTFVLEHYAGDGSISKQLLEVSNGSTSESIQLRYTSGASSQYSVTDGGTQIVNIAPSGFSTPNTLYKRAVSYSSVNAAQSINGEVATIDVTGSVPTVTQMDIGKSYTGMSQADGHISVIRYYPKQLTTAQLELLSTL